MGAAGREELSWVHAALAAERAMARADLRPEEVREQVVEGCQSLLRLVRGLVEATFYFVDSDSDAGAASRELFMR